jgi:hypothetical protein
LIVIERQLTRYAVRASFNRSSLWRVIAHITGQRARRHDCSDFPPDGHADSLYAKITPRQS